MLPEVSEQRPLPFEERVERAFELASQVPFPVQVCLIERINRKIEELGEKRWGADEAEQLITTVAPFLDTVVEKVIREGEVDDLTEIGNLTLTILEPPEFEEQRERLVIQLSEGIVEKAEETRKWELFDRAIDFYGAIDKSYPIEDLAVRLERISTETGDWRLLARAGEVWQSLEGESATCDIAQRLEKMGRDQNNPELLASAGRLLSKIYKERERGIVLLMEAGKIREAYERSKGPGIDEELAYRVEREFDKTEKGLFSQEQLLQGKGWLDEQARAWLKAGNPQRALEIALAKASDTINYLVNCKEIAIQVVQEKGMQAEAERIIRGMEPARAVWLSEVLGLPSALTRELIEKALRCSDQRIGLLSEEAWLIQERIRTLAVGEDKKTLTRELSGKRQKLIKTYLERGKILEAADYAEEIGRKAQAREIRTREMQRRIQDGKYDRAVSLAQEIGDKETEYQLYLRQKGYDKALSLALKEGWEERVLDLVQSHLSEINQYSGSLFAVLSFLKERTEKMPGAEEARLAAADYLKPYYEKQGSLSKAAEMLEILGQTEQAAVYKELDTLVPTPEHRECYITTACCEVMGLTDDCEVLTNLRWLRDNYMASLPGAAELINLYYQTAPKILEKISKEALKALFSKAIKPASDLVKAGDYQAAFELYTATLQKLGQEYLQ